MVHEYAYFFMNIFGKLSIGSRTGSRYDWLTCGTPTAINRISRLTPWRLQWHSSGRHLSRDASITCGSLHHLACK